LFFLVRFNGCIRKISFFFADFVDFWGVCGTPKTKNCRVLQKFYILHLLFEFSQKKIFFEKK